MADPVRAWIHAVWNVDDPVAPGDLPGPRLRLRLREGEDPEAAADEALSRALAVIRALPGPLLLRIVSRGGPPASAEWFPGLPILIDESSIAGGAARTIHSLRVTPDHPGIDAVVRAAIAGGSIELWIRGDDLLLRLVDGPDGDLWGASEGVVRALGELFAAWRVDPSAAARDVRCRLALVCDVQWRDMTPTEREGVRRCGRCEREVFEVRDQEQFLAHARRGECVAAPPGLVSVGTLASTWIHERSIDAPLAGIPARPEVHLEWTPEPRRPWWRRLLGR
ncbi:MAG: hypothetical protein R3B09_13350 [Nannocystaceae bacterium]